jgi:hypothetical protein
VRYHVHHQFQISLESSRLDDGEGKDVDLDVCPRERLERQKVRYLSFEERQAYLVKIDRVNTRSSWGPLRIQIS